MNNTLHFEQYFSAPRVNRYLIATGNFTGKAVKLYKANLKISPAIRWVLLKDVQGKGGAANHPFYTSAQNGQVTQISTT
ncbi:hypothetical protein [Mucilaginibacter arboris]|uniref:Uncharacterized protein n=1 Tax=Mucilaginibacter arboris TaxID=2682090 RepID=A0A7K1STK6_9SPHI|nr:hypothetical protein [Mucilaginibacter arboris]MVN20638.1 hypothetical protein [Mucilaginibacter arboris]